MLLLLLARLVVFEIEPVEDKEVGLGETVVGDEDDDMDV